MTLRIEDVEKAVRRQRQQRGRIPGEVPIETFGLPLQAESKKNNTQKKIRPVILFTALSENRNIQCSNKRVGGGTKLNAATRAHFRRS